MDILSAIISLFSLLFSIITFTKLHIVYIPMIVCEMVGMEPQMTKTILATSVILWLIVVMKSIINHFK